MPEPLTQHILDWRAVYGHIYSALFNLHNHLHYAADQCEAENWAGLAISLDNCAGYAEDAAFHFKAGSPNLWTEMYDCMHWIDDNWPEVVEPPEVTMSAILAAMDKALPHQPLLFVAYVEAYYASAWDATFDERYFADLVKRWKIWG